MATKRGRKSTDDLLTVGPVIVAERPEAPYTLWRDEEAEVWRRVVEDLPPGRITGRNADLLAEYCSHVVSAQRIRQMIRQAETGGDTIDLGEWRALMRAHAQQSARVQSLATSLRIAPQVTIGPKAGGRVLACHFTGKKPWDT